MRPPRFSVIIPTLNEEKFLLNLLASLVDQTEKPFEVIVVDGKSKDTTVAVAQSFKKKLPIRVIVCERASLPMQRNRGAAQARGEWLVFVDADSVLLPYFFDRISTFIKEEKPSLFTTWFRPDSEVSGDAMLTLLANMTVEGSLLFHRPFAPGPLTIISRHAYEGVGGYDETHTYHEDMDFSLRAYERGFTMSVMKESLCVWSLRRIRHEGALKLVQQSLLSSLPILLLKKTFRSMPGYIMGGQLYDKQKKPIHRSVLKKYELKLKKMMKEVFG
ncbi:MAG: glycosyltransferase [Actinobacteria bacterium]|nr:glycosyltransferase [Actinomycetota bacterium]